ncbi:hypothetical protein BD626DRAFT_574193 [Schizophyllum amplum]|uniref:Uncharacterized protein n=1 Tax=Schizophyllum amplum TaxID=97359 RepID=A0A550BYQ5_9AGAR|nr:hypothetical protein BD626DRAFT_574193 [Auriculariopsis ampla]
MLRTLWTNSPADSPKATPLIVGEHIYLGLLALALELAYDCQASHLHPCSRIIKLASSHPRFLMPSRPRPLSHGFATSLTTSRTPPLLHWVPALLATTRPARPNIPEYRDVPEARRAAPSGTAHGEKHVPTTVAARRPLSQDAKLPANAYTQEGLGALQTLDFPTGDFTLQGTLDFSHHPPHLGVWHARARRAARSSGAPHSLKLSIAVTRKSSLPYRRDPCVLPKPPIHAAEAPRVSRRAGGLPAGLLAPRPPR